MGRPRTSRITETVKASSRVSRNVCQSKFMLPRVNHSNNTDVWKNQERGDMAVRLSRDQNYRWRFWSLPALSSPGPSFLRPKNLGNLPGQKCWEQNAQIVRLNRSLDLEVKMHYLRQSVTDWPAGQ